jgi:hypothetical protein
VRIVASAEKVSLASSSASLVMGERVGQPKSCFGNQGNNQFYSLLEQKLLNRPSLQSGSTTELRQSLK